jgi:hypothetical protein
MNDSLDIRDLLVAISRMPEDRRVRSSNWYESQKEHWIGWLLDYEGPGAYRRKNHGVSDARSVYNRLACPAMLLYLATGSGVSSRTLSAARAAERRAGPSKMSKCSAIRSQIPWAVVREALRKCGHLPVRSL